MTPYDAMSEVTTMLLQYGGALKLPNRNFDAPDDGAPWGEVSFLHGVQGEASIGGADGKKRFASSGIATVEMFFPTGIGMELPYKECEKVASIFRGKHSPTHEVWFRGVGITERATSRHKGRLQIDVSFTFEYDQFN